MDSDLLNKICDLCEPGELEYPPAALKGGLMHKVNTFTRTISLTVRL